MYGDTFRSSALTKREKNFEGKTGFMGMKKAQVLNKNAAEQQITAEQLIREATERANVVRLEPKQDIIGEDELQSYQARKRKEFEDSLRMNRQHMGTWAKYAQFEASMKEFARARNVFERALTVDMSSTSVWLKYITFEQKEGFINHARNLFDRVVVHLPRVDQFWYKYAYMEELLGNFGGARTIFERWMEFEPEDNAWTSFAKFEERCGEIDRARRVFERYVSCHCTQQAFLRLVKFEERHANNDPLKIKRTRSGYEKALELLGNELDEQFYIQFAHFEIRAKEYDRARAIFKGGLELITKDRAEDLYQKYVNFEKIYGKPDQIEDVVMQKRRFAYEETLKDKPRDYDTWFDYLRLEEQGGDITQIRELYERAIAQFPPVAQKDYWKRYIYLWYNYALFEETVAEDYPKTRKVYDTAVKLTATKKLTFAKLYKLYSEFELRRGNLEQARRIFGRGIGECGKQKIFEWYADVELRFGNFDKCRTIYEKLCEKHPLMPQPWIRYVEFEESLEEYDRCRFLCETALDVVQDLPELMWRKYIDLEISLNEFDKARDLLERLLEKTNHVRVWRTYAEFELETARNLPKMRALFERGLKEYKEQKMNEQRAMLLEQWLQLEKRARDEIFVADEEQELLIHVNEEDGSRKAWYEKIQDRQPKKKKVRKNILKRKIPPPHIGMEICDAGFVYTNRICLAVEDCRQIRSSERGGLG
ncbi:unnamed protein product [Amoebophrya sp. A120]|nr:unnamed protein product [Amoebophrya sp. A120]|eukprot:GSA120T00014810001.1